MSFKSRVSCDGCACFTTVELWATHPSEVEIEYNELEDKGWLIEFNDDYDYCPKCAPIVLEEMADQANDVE